MTEIQLTNGGVAMVDDADAPLVQGYRWRRFDSRNASYATRVERVDGQKRIVLMHRQLLGLGAAGEQRIEVDHLNHNGLDNRRNNLRAVTIMENQHNQLPKGGTSKYRGVSWSARISKWIVVMRINKRLMNFGAFPTEQRAAEIHDAAVYQFRSSHAAVNFPKRAPSLIDLLYVRERVANVATKEATATAAGGE